MPGVPIGSSGPTREIAQGNGALEEAIGFARAVRAGNFIAVSGTAPIGPGGKAHAPGDLYEQTCRSLEIIEEALAALGVTLAQVVRTRIMLVNIGDWQEAARAHNEVFGDIKPACTFVEISRFIDPEWLVEIEADCII
jgi:enamine deaminase RidA (YjgF/YER057c/UK114 family)